MYFARSRMQAIPFIGAAAAAAFFVLPASGHAALVQPSSCQPTQLSEPFASLGDDASYEPVSAGFALSEGDSVTTDPACVNVSHPAVRFFVHGDPGATVSVAAVFFPGDAAVSVPIGSVPATAGVSPAMAVNVVNMPALHGANATVQLRFTVQGGAAQVESVWIDPWGGW